MRKTFMLLLIATASAHFSAQALADENTRYGYCYTPAKKDDRKAMIFTSVFEEPTRFAASGKRRGLNGIEQNAYRNKFAEAAQAKFPDWKIDVVNGGCPMHFASKRDVQRDVDEGISNHIRYGYVLLMEWRP